jgi:hypothetical protein
MLAKKISAAIAHDPVTQSKTTPLKIVSCCEPNNEPVWSLRSSTLRTDPTLVSG